MKYIQRLVLTLVLALCGSLALEARAQSVDPRLQDMVLGKPEAPVTIIEYASLTCPHCASFHEAVLPALKTEFIDTGKVKLIFRDFPLDQLAFAGAVLARCGGPDKYFTFLNVLFAQQRQWAAASDPKAALTQIGRLGGVSSEQFETCLTDKALGEYILNSRLEGNQKFNVNSTPTLIVDGQNIGTPSLDELRQRLVATGKLDKPAAAAPSSAAAPMASGGSDTMPLLVGAAILLLAVLAGGIWYFKRRRG